MSRPMTSGSLPRQSHSQQKAQNGMTQSGYKSVLHRTAASTPQQLSQKSAGGFYTQRRAVTACSVQNEDYEYQLPPRLNEPLEHMPASAKQHKHGSEKISLEEIEYLIRMKLRRERYALQCMFKNADSSGRGNINKGALLKILYSICGHIRIEQFHQLLGRYYLDELSSISFEIFEKCFTSPHGRAAPTKSWSGPPVTPPRYASLAHAHALLKSKLADGRCHIQELLPPACFAPGGVVLTPQFKEALDRADIRMTQRDFENFWQRLDVEGSGAVRTTTLCKFLAVDFPRSGSMLTAKSSTRRSLPNRNGYKKDGKKKDDEKKKFDKKDDAEDTELFLEKELDKEELKDKKTLEMAKSASEVPPEPPQTQKATHRPPGDTKVLTQHQRRLQMLRQRRPKFDDVMDSLFYLFEECYNALLVSFEHFDSKRDSFVPRLDFRNILREYGFGINALELEQFISRSGIRSTHSQVHYRDFLNKYQSKSERSVLNKLVQNNFHILNDPAFQAANDNLTAEQLEAKVVEFLHTDFLKFIGLLQGGDQWNRGTATDSFFRSCVEKVLDYPISDAQYDCLRKCCSRDRNGSILFYAFLKLFDKPPNSWNRKRVAGHEVAKVTGRPPTPPQLEVLRKVEEAAIAEMKSETQNQKTSRPVFSQRTFEDVCVLVEDTLRNRFHQVDALYKQMDRKNSGHLNKQQFGQILAACGLKLSDIELNKLWSTLDTNADGQWSYRQLLRHFMTDLRGKGAKVEAKERHERMKGFNDPNLRRLREYRRYESAQATLRQKKQEEAAAEKRAKSAVVAAAQVIEPQTVEMLCDKMRTRILQNWNLLKNSLRRIDQVGYAHVKNTEMKAVLRRCNVNLLESELTQLCTAFDLKKDGNFHYIEFLKLFVDDIEKPSENEVKVQNQRDGEYYAASAVIARLRNQLIHQWETLLRAFKKLDAAQSGFLEARHLRRALQACGMKLSEDDLFLILTEFDLNLDNKIDYQEFLKQMLNVC